MEKPEIVTDEEWQRARDGLAAAGSRWPRSTPGMTFNPN
jgi:hypothetical protein